MKSHIFTFTLFTVFLTVGGFVGTFHLTPFEIQKVREALKQLNKTQRSSFDHLFVARQAADLKIAPNFTATTTTTAKTPIARDTAATTTTTRAAPIAATPSATVATNVLVNSTTPPNLDLVMDEQMRSWIDFINKHWEDIAATIQSVVQWFYC